MARDEPDTISSQLIQYDEPATTLSESHPHNYAFDADFIGMYYSHSCSCDLPCDEDDDDPDLTVMMSTPLPYQQPNVDLLLLLPYPGEPDDTSEQHRR
jgi:hypothetical protein